MKDGESPNYTGEQKGEGREIIRLTRGDVRAGAKGQRIPPLPRGAGLYGGSPATYRYLTPLVPALDWGMRIVIY